MEQEKHGSLTRREFLANGGAALGAAALPFDHLPGTAGASKQLRIG